MTLIEHYFTYLQALADGSRTAPKGIELHETEPMPRAAELQAQIQAMGVPEFVRRCAAQEATFTLSIRTVSLPCSRSRTNLRPSPERMANSS